MLCQGGFLLLFSGLFTVSFPLLAVTVVFFLARRGLCLCGRCVSGYGCEGVHLRLLFWVLVSFWLGDV